MGGRFFFGGIPEGAVSGACIAGGHVTASGHAFTYRSRGRNG